MDLDQKKHDVDVLERVLGGGVHGAGAGEPGGDDEDQVVEVHARVGAQQREPSPRAE